MKRLIYCAAALATVLFAGSCNKELETALGGDSHVTFTVSTDEVVTKAEIADGTNIDALHWEIYLTASAASAEKPLGEGVVIDKDGDKKFTVDLNLVADQEYSIIFWAQKMSKDDGTNAYYTWTDLRKVKIDYAIGEGKEHEDDEDRAAFFAVHEFDTKNGPVDEDVYLKRPFAQLNLGATNLETSLNNVNGGIIVIKSTDITVKNVANLFNTLDGKGEDEGVLTYKRERTPYYDYKAKHLVVNNVPYHWLSMNYLAVYGDTYNVDLDIKVNTTVGTVEHNITNVPIKENHRTNILGDLLTTAASFQVIVDEEFDTPDLGPADVLKNVLAEGGEYTLLEDLTISENFSLSRDVVVNLNGHKFTYDGADAIFARVQSGATLTFNGPGSVESTGYVASANSGGKVVVKVGDYFTSSPTLFQANGGEVEIFGGSFANENDTYGALYLLNHIDAKKNNGLITVYGGSFKNYNPAESHSESPAMNFCADGYMTVSAANGSDVVYTVVPGAAETQAAASEGKDVSLYEDLTISESETLSDAPIKDYKTGIVQNGGVIDGKGNVISVEGVNTLGVVTSGGTIRNVTFDSAKRAVYVQNATDDIILENVNFTGEVGYALNTGTAGDADVKIAASGCNFIGWTSFAGVESATFTDCSFAFGSYWQKNGYDASYDRHIKPYVSTTFVNCDFCKDFCVDLSALASGQKVIFEGCTVDGAPLASEDQLNWDTYSDSSVVIK